MTLPLLVEQDFVGRQAEFHASQARFRWMIAGNRAGKSRALCREAAYHCTGLHPWRDVATPTTGWIVALDHDTCVEILLPCLLEYLPADMIRRVSYGDIPKVELRDGSKVLFKFYSQGWTKFQAAAVDWIAFDEEPVKKIYDECRMRIIDRKGAVWVAMTPLQGKTWVWHQVVRRVQAGHMPDTAIFSWASTDNSAIDPEEVRAALADVPQHLRSARLRGDFVDLEGLIYPHFSRQVHVVPAAPLEQHWPIVVGLDPGDKHPFGVVCGAVRDDGSTVWWRAWKRPGALVSSHARNILDAFRRYAPHAVNEAVAVDAFDPRRPADYLPPGSCFRARFVMDRSAAAMRREFGRYGIAAVASNSDVHAGIGRVAELLQDTIDGRAGLTLMEGRTGDAIDEFEGYSWKVRPDDDTRGNTEPQATNDDCMDAGRYCAMECPRAGRIPRREPPDGSFAHHMAVRRESQRVAAMGYGAAELLAGRMLTLGRSW